MDAVLAAELRTTLGVPVVEAPAHLATKPADRARPGDAATAEASYRALESPDHVDASDLIVEPEDDPLDLSAESGTVTAEVAVALAVIDPPDGLLDAVVHEAEEAAPASYPALPAPPESDTDSPDATQVVLREIRDRLATPPRPAQRRFRTRFTIASSMSALLALGALVLDVYVGTVPA